MKKDEERQRKAKKDKERRRKTKKDEDRGRKTKKDEERSRINTIHYADDCICPFTKEERLEAFSDYGLTFGLICDTSCRYYIQQERCQYKCK